MRSRSCSATCTRTCSRCRSRCWRSAFALQVALFGPRGDVPRLRALLETLVAGLSLGTLYAINSWSYPVMAGVLAAALVALAA